MCETIKLNSKRYYAMLVIYLAILVACLYAGYTVYSISLQSKTNPEVDDGRFLLIPIGIVFVEFLFILIHWVNRKLSKKEFVTITDKGLENVYTFFGFMIFFFMPTATLIPWEAIQSFKITENSGRKYVVAVINASKLPDDFPRLIRFTMNGKLGGFYFGSRSCEYGAESLLQILNRSKPV